MEKIHSFDTALAMEFSVEKAIILATINHWVSSNKQQKMMTCFKHDRWWTFLSRKTIQHNHQYMKAGSIGVWIIELENLGWIKSFSFNENLPSGVNENTKAYTHGDKYLAYLSGDFSMLSENNWIVIEEKRKEAERLALLGANKPLLGANKPLLGANSIEIQKVNSELNSNNIDSFPKNAKPDPDGIIDNVPPKSKGKRINGKDAMKSFFDKDDEVFQKFDNPVLMFENWEVWLQYKNENKKSFKSATSEKIGIKQLAELSNTIAQNAVKIIETSIASGWQGLFEPKGKFIEPQKLPENKEILTASEEYKLYEKIKTRLSLRECTDEQIMILLKYEPYNQEISKQIEIRKERKTWTL